MESMHDKKMKSPAPLSSHFKVEDLVWSLVPPSTKTDAMFPDRVSVVIVIKGERTYENVNFATGNKVIRIS